MYGYICYVLSCVVVFHPSYSDTCCGKANTENSGGSTREELLAPPDARLRQILDAGGNGHIPMDLQILIVFDPHGFEQ